MNGKQGNSSNYFEYIRYFRNRLGNIKLSLPQFNLASIMQQSFDIERKYPLRYLHINDSIGNLVIETAYAFMRMLGNNYSQLRSLNIDLSG